MSGDYSMEDLTADERTALKIAEQLIDAGIPVFAAAPVADKPGEYYFPPEWEKTVPSRVWLEKWRPGWALGAVGGHAADFLDNDPRNGGDHSIRELEIQRQMPRVFGVQSTPSGGQHFVISPTGERKSTGFMPGLDLQSGAQEPDSRGKYGRGFVWIAPTVRPSKAPETLGELHAYRWEQEPDLEYLKEFPRGGDDTVEGIVARVHARRSSATSEGNVFERAAGSADPMFGPAPKTPFTLEQAQAFCLPHLEHLERAPIGEIEERCNAAAVALAHFVPAFWSAEQGFAVLTEALAKTAYDPDHPASTWTADKFLAVLDGSRPIADNWKADRAVTHAELAETPAPLDAVDALLAEMVNPSALREQAPPRMLIKGLLTLDSESWIIGAPGSKKSFVVLDMAAHVADGRPWMDLPTVAGDVVMIVAEGSGGLGPRIRAWEKQNSHPMSDRMHILPRPVQAGDANAWHVLVGACRRLKPSMVVIDTQARVTVGLEENSAKEMGVYVEAVRAIREATGACVISVHHTGRGGGDARGSSAIDGAQTTELKVVSEPGSLKGVLKSEKQKDLALAPDVELTFVRHVVGVDEDGQEVSSLALTSNPFEAAAVDAMFGPDGEVDVESWRGQEPGAWTVMDGVPANAKQKRRILQVLADHARDLGLTESQVKSVVKERWEEPSRSGWATAWQEVTALECVVNTRGERWTLDRVEVGLA